MLLPVSKFCRKDSQQLFKFQKYGQYFTLILIRLPFPRPNIYPNVVRHYVFAVTIPNISPTVYATTLQHSSKSPELDFEAMLNFIRPTRNAVLSIRLAFPDIDQL